MRSKTNDHDLLYAEQENAQVGGEEGVGAGCPVYNGPLFSRQ